MPLAAGSTFLGRRYNGHEAPKYREILMFGCLWKDVEKCNDVTHLIVLIVLDIEHPFFIPAIIGQNEYNSASDVIVLFGISLETNKKKISLDLGNTLKRTHCWSMICLLEHYPPLLTNPQNSHLVEEHVGPQHELEIRRRLLAIFKLIPIERIWRGIKLLINSWWISLINWPRSTTAQQASHWFSWPQLKPS